MHIQIINHSFLYCIHIHMYIYIVRYSQFRGRELHLRKDQCSRTERAVSSWIPNSERSQTPDLPVLCSRSFFHWFLFHRKKKHIDLLEKGTECNQQIFKTHNDLALFLQTCTCVCSYRQYTYTSIYIYIYVCMYVWMYVCVYIYIYIYVFQNV